MQARKEMFNNMQVFRSRVINNDKEASNVRKPRNNDTPASLPILFCPNELSVDQEYHWVNRSCFYQAFSLLQNHTLFFCFGVQWTEVIEQNVLYLVLRTPR